MGSAFNSKLAKFKMYAGKITDQNHSFEFESVTTKEVPELSRLGHLTFMDSKTGNLLIFGGQIESKKYKKNSSRTINNSIVIFNPHTLKQVDIIQYTEAAVPTRMYASGFKIDHKIFVIGGLGLQGHVL